MKVHRILAFSGLVVLGQLARAEAPAPNPNVLGTTEAILAYCAKADPSAASKYMERVQLVTQGASDEILAKVRKSDEYQQAHESAEESLAKVDEKNALKVCSQSLAQNR